MKNWTSLGVNIVLVIFILSIVFVCYDGIMGIGQYATKYYATQGRIDKLEDKQHKDFDNFNERIYALEHNHKKYFFF